MKIIKSADVTRPPVIVVQAQVLAAVERPGASLISVPPAVLRVAAVGRQCRGRSVRRCSWVAAAAAQAASPDRRCLYSSWARWRDPSSWWKLSSVAGPAAQIVWSSRCVSAALALVSPVTRDQGRLQTVRWLSVSAFPGRRSPSVGRSGSPRCLQEHWTEAEVSVCRRLSSSSQWRKADLAARWLLLSAACAWWAWSLR